MKISAVVIAFNEEKKIERCLRSLSEVADELIVVDSGSTDNTVLLAENCGAKVIYHPFKGHIEQKNFALQLASFQYILSLDADEELSAELIDSIKKEKPSLHFDGFEMNRLNNFCGKWIRHCGWYPDKKLRFFLKEKAVWGGTNPHDKVIMKPNSKIAFLKGDILHYTIETISDHIKQIDFFTNISSQEYFNKGKRATIFHVLFSPLFKFVKMYFLKLGFLDGYYGFVLCINSAHSSFLKYTKLYKLQSK